LKTPAEEGKTMQTFRDRFFDKTWTRLDEGLKTVAGTTAWIWLADAEDGPAFDIDHLWAGWTMDERAAFFLGFSVDRDHANLFETMLGKTGPEALDLDHTLPDGLHVAEIMALALYDRQFTLYLNHRHNAGLPLDVRLTGGRTLLHLAFMMGHGVGTERLVTLGEEGIPIGAHQKDQSGRYPGQWRSDMANRDELARRAGQLRNIERDRTVLMGLPPGQGAPGKRHL
jgi:hypothetical protein